MHTTTDERAERFHNKVDDEENQLVRCLICGWDGYESQLLTDGEEEPWTLNFCPLCDAPDERIEFKCESL